MILHNITNVYNVGCSIDIDEVVKKVILTILMKVFMELRG